MELNLDSIKGHTIILADVSRSMQCPISGKKYYGSNRSFYEVALLLGLLIKSKCKKSSYYLFSSNGATQKPFLEVNFASDNILDNMKVLSKEIGNLGWGENASSSLVQVLQLIKKSTDVVDNIVLLSDLMISDGFNDFSDHDGSPVDFLKDYVNTVNPNMKIFSVDLKGYGQ